MITIFNRKLIYTSFSMKDQAEIKTILDNNGIKYYQKIVNRKSDGIRSRIGSFGENSDYMYEYTIYVHKKDFDLANKYIHDQRN